MKLIKLCIVLYGYLFPFTLQSQIINFEKTLHLDTCGEFGELWGQKRWKLPENKKNSGIDSSLWGHILPKAFISSHQILLTPKELNYFYSDSKHKIQKTSSPISVPDHWESNFGRQVVNLKFDPPITALIITSNSFEWIKIDSLSAERYYSWIPLYYFNPYDTINDHVHDSLSVPIVYNITKNFKSEPKIICLISDFGASKLISEKIRVKTDTVNIGTKEYPSPVAITKVDVNNNNEPDIILFKESISSQEIEDELDAWLLGIYHEKKWYRTSFSSPEDDGDRGF